MKRWLMIFTAVLAILLVSGCSNNAASDNGNENPYNKEMEVFSSGWWVEDYKTLSERNYILYDTNGRAIFVIYQDADGKYNNKTFKKDEDGKETDEIDTELLTKYEFNNAKKLYLQYNGTTPLSFHSVKESILAKPFTNGGWWLWSGVDNDNFANYAKIYINYDNNGTANKIIVKSKQGSASEEIKELSMADITKYWSNVHWHAAKIYTFSNSYTYTLSPINASEVPQP